jgi:hypothetical protein
MPSMQGDWACKIGFSVTCLRLPILVEEVTENATLRAFITYFRSSRALLWTETLLGKQ